MDKKKNSSAFIIKLDRDNYKRDKTVCKSRYKEKKRKNNKINTLIQN